MKYIDFQNIFKNHPLIDVREVKNIFPDFDSRRFYEWQKKGYIKKITKLFYIFINKKITENDIRYIANKLLEPSYLSLEYALRYYNLIPEIVYVVTSITTRKTKTINNEISNFQYRSIKENLFFGYKIIKINEISFKIAEPEKALLDFLYLRGDIKNKNDIKELRLNKEVFKEIINQKKLKQYTEVFNSKTLLSKVIKINKIMEC
jgi:predicted transcriptional regulator of viral defense system